MTKPRPNSITPPTAPIEDILAGLIESAPTTSDGKKNPFPTATYLRPQYVHLAKAVSADKFASYRANLCWVFDNCGTDPAEIDVTKIPSRGAVKMLSFAQANDITYSKFLDWHAKAVNDKSVAEAAAQAEYDERRQTTLLNDILGKYNTDGARPELNGSPGANLPGS